MHRVAGVGCAKRSAGARAGRIVRASQLDAYAIERQAERVGGDLGRDGVRASAEKHRGLDRVPFEIVLGLLRYIDGDYRDPATFQALRRE
jgi:glucose-6-phosphate 1-dehydrogenase